MTHAASINTEPDRRAVLRRLALSEGFDVIGFAAPDAIAQAAPRLAAFLAQGRHGDMGWMETSSERRMNPQHLWPQARSVIMLGLNYHQGGDPLKMLEARNQGVISVYAKGHDYHNVFKKKLKNFARSMVGAFPETRMQEPKMDVKIFVDTAPVMEKPLAAAAGIGWQGKHTNLVSRDFGSWLFLGAVFTTLELGFDQPANDACGHCQACLDICPTRAFPKAYELDARRCISYLTIEHKGHIPLEFRQAMGNRIYGCDDCLAVCPWNKFARLSHEMTLSARAELAAPLLKELVRLDDQHFRKFFSGSPVKRTGRARFVRNVLIAIGNSGNQELAQEAKDRLEDDSALVRAMAVWALGRLSPERDFADLRGCYEHKESDEDVRAEWQRDYGFYGLGAPAAPFTSSASR